MKLSEKKCEACDDNAVTKMDPQDATKMLLQYTPEWELRDEATALYREYTFKNFKLALAFVDKVGAIAEQEKHHPDIAFGWGYVKITLQTHSIGGLHENDFIVASKIDEID